MLLLVDPPAVILELKGSGYQKNFKRLSSCMVTELGLQVKSRQAQFSRELLTNRLLSSKRDSTHK